MHTHYVDLCGTCTCSIIIDDQASLLTVIRWFFLPSQSGAESPNLWGLCWASTVAGRILQREVGAGGSPKPLWFYQIRQPYQL